MRTNSLFLSAIAALAVLSVAGCASNRADAGNSPRQVFALKYPPITNAISILLTNTDGFSAQVVMKNKENTFTGELLGAGGRLLFLPSSASKKSEPTPDAMSFIWDGGGNNGFVLCEALQGYAPFKSQSAIEIKTLENENPVFETVRGRSCRKSEFEVKTGDGGVARYVVWQSTDSRRFPVRIESAPGESKFSIELSKIQFKTFEPDLFLPPSGFTRYANGEVMLTELVVRTAAMKRPVDSRLINQPVNAYDDFQSPNHNQPGRGF